MKMKNSYIRINKEVTVWLHKSFDFAHGYGWHCQIYINNEIGYGFSKNKFTAYRIANNNIKEII